MLRPYVACLPSLSLHRQDRHPLDRFAGTLRVEIERAQRLDLVSPPLEPRRCRHPKSIHVEDPAPRSEEHTSELQSQSNLVCRLLLEKKKKVRTLLSHLTDKHTHSGIPTFISSLPPTISNSQQADSDKLSHLTRSRPCTSLYACLYS